MSLHEVSEFIVIAPAGMGKSIQWAERELHGYLQEHFPSYRFRIEPFGPFAADDCFSIIPIMNRMPLPSEEVSESDATFMCHLRPTVIPEILSVLSAFDPTGASVH